jgi:hypothetical protein
VALVLIVFIAILYLIFQAPASTTASTTTIALTTAGGVTHYNTTTVGTTTVAFNASQYTTTPPVAGSTASGGPEFVAFINSTQVNSTLNGNYNESDIYEAFPDNQAPFAYGINYTNNESESFVTITLSEFNTTNDSYSDYNQTYGQIYAWSKTQGGKYYTSTYTNASYVIMNVSEPYLNSTLNYYESDILYSNFVIEIDVTQLGGNRFSMQQIETLTKAEIDDVSGND